MSCFLIQSLAGRIKLRLHQQQKTFILLEQNEKSYNIAIRNEKQAKSSGKQKSSKIKT